MGARESTSFRALVKTRPGSRHTSAHGSGLIPARGETTCRRGRCASAARAHPRSRGDDVIRCAPIAADRGSSPLAGRRRVEDWSAVGCVGPIPARGETTRSSCRSPRAGPAHPRSRGDDRLWATAAGGGRAHPHSRGDDRLRDLIGSRRDGSSPLAGRRQVHARVVRAWVGLIPARGETTRCRSSTTRPPRAHPRSRGDDGQVRVQTNGQVGSSPLAGRRLVDERDVLVERRLIPARGETTINGDSAVNPDGGSSPLARGGARHGPTGLDQVGVPSPRAGVSHLRSRASAAGAGPLSAGGVGHYPPRRTAPRPHGQGRAHVRGAVVLSVGVGVGARKVARVGASLRRPPAPRTPIRARASSARSVRRPRRSGCGRRRRRAAG